MAADRLRIFIDADALLAGCASTTGASFVVLHLADLTMIDGITSEQVIIEAGRNLAAKLPDKLPAFKAIVNSALMIVPDPSHADMARYLGHADPKDVSILTAAIMNQCRFLLTFNTRHYEPPEDVIEVLRPGDFLVKLREHLAGLI